MSYEDVAQRIREFGDNGNKGDMLLFAKKGDEITTHSVKYGTISKAEKDILVAGFINDAGIIIQYCTAQEVCDWIEKGKVTA